MPALAATSFDVATQPHVSVPCNQCGSTTQRVVATRDRYGLRVTTVACACGLHFINPRMTPAGYAEFYRTHYRRLLERVYLRPYTEAMVAENQRKYSVVLLRELAKIVEPFPRSTVVDLGGSTGTVARAFAQRWGCRATVVDPAPGEVAKAEDFAATVCASAEDVRFPDASFDVVLLCRTIEHLLDPKGVLERARRWVTPTGFLIVDAQDVTRWEPATRYKVDHPYAFTADTLERMVTSAGWRVRGRWRWRNGQYVGLACSP